MLFDRGLAAAGISTVIRMSSRADSAKRIAIARALALNPKLIIADEPVGARRFRAGTDSESSEGPAGRPGADLLVHFHNLAVVDYIADRIAVMCAGCLVETAPRDVLFRAPVHPYTKALLSAVPEPDLDARLDLRAIGR